jgi:predicted DCC family thiol-disulfide oxidoreductase YuxK
MQRLTVLYDSHCGLCRKAKEWLEGQPAYLTLEFLPAGSPQAEARFPTLNRERTLAELTVISDDGNVYQGEGAFLMCLYALYDYRAHSIRLASPFWRPVFRFGLGWVERLRGTSACDGACGVHAFEGHVPWTPA